MVTKNKFLYMTALIAIQVFFTPLANLHSAAMPLESEKERATNRVNMFTKHLTSVLPAQNLTAGSPEIEALSHDIKNLWTVFMSKISNQLETHNAQPGETKKEFLESALTAALAETAIKTKYPHLESIIQRLLINATMELFAIDSREDQAVSFSDNNIDTDDLWPVIKFIREADIVTKTQKQLDALNPHLQTILFYIKEFKDTPSKETLDSLKATIDTIQSTIQTDPDFAGQNINHFLNSINDIYTSFNDFEYQIEQNTLTEKYKREIQQIADAIERYFKLIQTKFSTKDSMNRIANIRKNGALLFDKPKELDWCGCEAAPFEKRIALIILMMQDVVKNHPDKTKQLVYTSIASGDFLQDYLIVSELKHLGYTSIDINVIDLEISREKETYSLLKKSDAYTIVKTLMKGKVARSDINNPDYSSNQNTLESIKSESQHHKNKLLTALNSQFYQASFKRKIGALFLWTGQEAPRKIAATKGLAAIQITSWKNTYDYIAFAHKNPDYKTDILLLTDTGGSGTYSQFSTKNSYDTKNNAVALMLQKTEPIKSEPEEEIKEWDADGQNPTPDTTDADFLNQKSIRMTLSESAPFFEIYTNMLPEHHAEYEQALETIKLIIAADNGGDSTPLGKKIQDVFAFALGNHFDIEWIGDAHLALGDIVRQASKNKATIYTLDLDPTAKAKAGELADDDSSDLCAYSKENYLKRTSLINPEARNMLLKKNYKEEKIINTPAAKMQKLRAQI